MLCNPIRIRPSPLLISSSSHVRHILSSRPISLRTQRIGFTPRTDQSWSLSHLHETFPKTIIGSAPERISRPNRKRGKIDGQIASSFEDEVDEGLSEEEKKKICEIYEGWSKQHKKILREIVDNPTEEQKKKIKEFLKSFSEAKMKEIRKINHFMNDFNDQEKMIVVTLLNLRRRFGFLKKVFGILAAQLLLSIVVYAAMKMCPPITAVLKQNYICLFCLLFTVCLCFLPTSRASKDMGIIRKKSILKNSTIQGLVNMATVSLGVVLVDIHLVNSNGIIMLAALLTTLALSVFLMVATFLEFVVTHEDLSSVGSPISSNNMLIVLLVGSLIQIINPGPITAAIEIGLYAWIFGTFVMCHTWMILKRYEHNEYMMASSNLLLHMFGLFIFSIKVFWMIFRLYIWSDKIFAMISAFLISLIKSLD